MQNDVEQTLTHLASGDPEAAKAALRSAVRQAGGFESFGRAMGIPAKSLIRMVSPKGNPSLSNLSLILKTLIAKRCEKVSVKARPQPIPKRREQFVKDMAAKYMWWKPLPASPLRQRTLALVMDMGEEQDVQEMRRLFRRQELGAVLKNAHPGWFRPRSWHYWHFVLTAAKPGSIPPMPKRPLP